jgi:thiol-disulfide isomerase/thioredoxin
MSSRRAVGLVAVLVLVGASVSALAQFKAAKPWIGIAIEDGAKGVRIKSVMTKTPAEAAGLKPGDEVLSIDGTAVKKPGELIAKVQDKGVGTTVTLHVLRDGKELDIKLALAARPDEQQMLRDNLIGKPAPAFAFSGGDKVGPHAASLADLKGNVIVVEFWATWCGPCRSTMPTLTDWQKKYGAKGLRVVGISSEGMDKVKPFAEKEKLGYTVAADPDSKVGLAYGIPAIPTIIVIDQQGVVRFAEVGAGDNLAAAEKLFVSLLPTDEPAKPKK